VNKYSVNITCNYCGEEFTTGWCKNRIERTIKRLKLEHKHKKGCTKGAKHGIY